MDREGWRATVRGVTQSQTQLSGQAQHSADWFRDYHTKEVKSEKDKFIGYCLYVGSKKNGTDEFMYKAEIESQT